VIVMSHLGRPNAVDPELSLRPVAIRLSRALDREVHFAEDCVGEPARTAVGKLQNGEVVLLENVRFHPEEEANDPDFAHRLASLGDLYVNDAFAASHRAHASVVGVAAYLPAFAGELMEAELTALHQALDNPRRPMLAVVGGAKVSTKVGVLHNLLNKVDALLIGGAMANTFFKARGYPTGSGLVEESALEAARQVAEEGGHKLLLPVDLVCARRMEPGQPLRIMEADAVEAGWMALDIGPKSVALFTERLRGAGAIVSFEIKGAHPHDVATIIDRSGVAVRAGTHCVMPLLERFNVTATCRASFGMYNTMEEVDHLAQALIKARELFS
jgi:phosphoglycerate kinase